MSDLSRRGFDPHERIRFAARLFLSTVYLAAGVLHVAAPDKFLPIVPGWVPDPHFTVVATGFCEIVGSLALLTTRLMKLAGLMLALYAICVFPANVKHALEHIDVPGLPSSWRYHAPRLALQPVLVWWALWSSDAID